MKKVTVFMAAVIGAVVLSSCAAEPSGNQATTVHTTTARTTSVAGGTTAVTGVWSDMGVYVGDVVPDKRTAQKIADVLFAEIIEKTKSEYTYTNVSYDEEQSAWVVVYCLNENTLGGYAIVISKKTGEVLRIEYGE